MNVKDDVSTNWKMFRQAWQYYSTATELTKKPKEVQAGALCSVMGMDCVKVMNSLTTLNDDDKKDPEKILSALGDHFMPQKHLLFERVKFGFANQAEHETIDQYVVRLRQLAESCEFEGLCESLIRDRLVIGTCDSATRDRLLRERPVPGLTRCVEALRASELSRVHREQFKDAVADPPNTVHATNKYNSGKEKHSRSGQANKPRRGNPVKTKADAKGSCKFCGTNHPYDRSKCPASGQTCLKCGKQGHFAVKCRGDKQASTSAAKKVHHTSGTQRSAEEGDESDDSIFITERVGVVSSNVGRSTFMVPLTFHTEYSPTVTTQLDTGATCSAMSYADLLRIVQSGEVKLEPPGGKIRLYDGRVVTLLGSYTFTVSQKGGRKCKIPFDILENAPWPIIDGNTCIQQGWISLGVDQSIHSSSKQYEPLSFEELLRDYDDVFTGLGYLPGEYHIEVDPDVKPVQHAPRRVPVPLKAKLKEKIEEMEQHGIIIKETEPTEWISSLVAVQKPEKLRVCIDPRDLNKAIKRPKYQMPTVDEVLPKLANAKVFTVLDATLQSLMNTIMTGWPMSREDVPVSIREFWNYKEELTVQDGVLYKGMKVIVPTSMRPQMIARVHSSHLGPDACARRARDVLFWPGMVGQIKEQVQSCEVCNDFLARQQKEPLMTHKIPDTPWSKVGQDLFVLGKENYLVTVDFYSDYFELDLLKDTTAETVINATKSHFARHGIADMVTDNGPQYSSEQFATFSREWEFQHTTSSPLHSQSNGKSESAVKIAKNLVKKAKRDNKDVQMSLLEWRNTPDINGLSPVQKLMSRRTRTTIPTAEVLLKPEVADGVFDNIIRKRQQAKATYDKRARPLPELQVGEPVRLQPVNPKAPWEKGSCVAKVGPRSFLIETENGNLYRRNRKFIRQDPSQEQARPTVTNSSSTSQPSISDSVSTHPSLTQTQGISHSDPTTADERWIPQPQQAVVTRSGRTSVRPSKFKDFVT